jgi:hypothetical protein
VVKDEIKILDQILNFAIKQGFKKSNLQAKSFGSLVSLQYLKNINFDASIKLKLVVYGLPLKSLYSQNLPVNLPVETLIFQGENDHFGSSNDLLEYFKTDNNRPKSLEIISVLNSDDSFNKDLSIIGDITDQASNWLN